MPPEDRQAVANDPIDLLSSIIGECGRYQMLSMVILGSPMILISWSNFLTKFLTQEVDFWCKQVEISSIGARPSPSTKFVLQKTAESFVKSECYRLAGSIGSPYQRWKI